MRWTSALVLATVLTNSAAQADEERVLPAALDGDPALVAQVGDELARRGVSAGTGEEVVAANLIQEGDGIRVALRDPQGRTTLRLVSSVETAAALVESWARRDLSDPLLAPRAPPPPPPPPALEAAPAVVVPVPPVPVTPPVSMWTPVLRLGGETWDQSLWLAGSVGACTHVGNLCLGGAARLARQLEPSEGASDERFWMPQRQTDFEALAQAEWPIPLGRPVLLLGMGAGLGWRFDGSGAQASLRGEARAELALPIWSKLALDVGLTAAVAPDTSERDPRFPGPRPNETQIRMGFGLRWGLP